MKPPQYSVGIELRKFAGPTAYVGRFGTQAGGALRVAHLTDLHVGRVTPMKVQFAAVDMTNMERPDLVVITGDFVCHSQRYLDELYEVVRRFEAPVIGVLGNHDHWSGASEVRRVLRRAGAEVLDNRHTMLTLRGERLQVLGLDDAYTGNADRAAALKGLRQDIPTLGLSHIGEEADALWAAGVPFVLSGHTHAGQVTFARLHELAIGKLAGHRYVHGLYGTRQTAGAPHGALYVGAGIGASVMPLRLGERGRREIALFELGTPPGSYVEHHNSQPPLPGRKPTPEIVAKRMLTVAKRREKREKAAAKKRSSPKH